MSSNNSLGDPRSGRDRRVPTRKHAFERGTLDPISTVKKPMFTIGNGVLLVVIVAYGMYATGHLPQLDAFFDKADQYGKAHNNTVVNGILTYGTYLFFGVIALFVGLIIFSLVNGHRRRVTDRRADEIEERRRGDRRATPREPREDLPSMIVPLGKPAPARRATDGKLATPGAAGIKEAPAAATPVATPVPAATTPASTPPAPAVAATVRPEPAKAPVPSIFDSPDSGPKKAAAMAAAARAEAAAANAPQDMPSFVPMPGKQRIAPAEPKPTTRVMGTAQETAPAAEAKVEAPKPVEAPAPVVAAASSTGTAPTDAFAEAALAAARAETLKAEAAIAIAKLEAAVASAKAEAAVAEANAAAAKAAALAN